MTLFALADEIGALLLASGCTGCDRRGTLLCPPCRAALTAAVHRRHSPRGLAVTVALTFDGVPARCVRAVKEEGATSLCWPLGRALAAAVRQADASRMLLIPVPTSRAAFRRRGYRVPELLLRRAGETPARLLRAVRATADQRGLGRVERARNVAGSLRATRPGKGRDAVIVDDVMTTGATLDEAARALSAADFRVRGAVVLAATPRRGAGAVNSS